MNISPNVPNVIPGEVTFNIDIRHQEDNVRKNTTESLKERLSVIALRNNVEITMTTDWESNAVQFSDKVTESIKKAVDARDYTSMELYSGPGHDAKYMADIAETAMIFIPSKDGISHNEAEWSSKKDIARGATILLEVICDLARGERAR